MTKIDRENVERLAELLRDDAEKQNWQPCEMTGLLPDDEYEIAATIIALRAALNEAEAALDSAHAEVGSNIWRFWRDLTRKHFAKRQEAEARVEEARAVALEEALNKVSGCDRVSEVGPAIRALMDTTYAEALERVRTEEREACAKVAENYMGDNPDGLAHPYDRGWVRACDRIASAIRARRET